MKLIKRFLSLLAATGLLAGLMFTAAGPALADGTLVWNGVNGAGACDAGTTGTVLWIFNPHSDAVPTSLSINGQVVSGTWEQSGGGQNWHFVAQIPGTFADIDSASLTYTGTLGSNPLFTISGCNEGGGQPPAADLTITKDAAGTFDNEFGWDISKAVDKSSVEVTPGGSVTLHYTVTLTHDGGSIVNVVVIGDITVTNPNAASVNIDSLTDQLSDSTVCTITPVGAQSSTVMTSGDNFFTYECDLADGSAPSGLVNTATVTWSEQTLSDNSLLAAGTTFFDADVAFTGTDIDTCATVTDTLDGVAHDLGEHCVGDVDDIAGTITITYTRTFTGPALGTCVDHTNVASFGDNSTPQQVGASDQVTVTVCAFNAALTPGYWKTHLTLDSKHPNAPYTGKYLPQSLGNYVVNTTVQATAVFNAMNCSKSGDQNAIGCLAGHLLAAELNVANGSNTCINATILAANNFLISINYTGPTGTYHLTATQRATAITLKNALDKYNNGGGC
jgi:hypothetical protein